MMRAFFSSLRFRLLVLVLLAIIPAFGLIVYLGSQQQQHEAFEVRRDLKRLARLAAGDENRLIEGTYHLLVALARIPAVRGGNLRTCNALFGGLIKQYPHYANLGAIKANGDVFCSAVPLGAPVNVAGQGYFQRALKTREFAMGEYQLGHIADKVTTSFGYPILDKAGRVQSVVFAGLDLSWLNRFVAEAGLPRGSTLMVIDGNGMILANHPGAKQWVGKVMADSPLVKEITTRGDGVVEMPGLDGVLRLNAFTRLGSTDPDTYVSIGVSSEQAFADPNRIFAHTLLGLALVTALALAAAWVGGDLVLLRRMRALASATKRLGAGELSARTGPPYVRGEVGELARAFDEMAAGLEEHESERKRAVGALRETNETLTAVIQSSPMGVAILDTDGNVTLWNPAAERMFGWRQEEVLGRPPPTIPPDKRDEHRALRERALRDEAFADMEVIRRKKDGSPIDISLSTAPLRDAAGNIRGVMGIMADITERKRAEEGQARLLAILEATTDFVAIGSPDGRVFYYNRAARRMLGIGEDEDISHVRIPDTHPEWAGRIIMQEGIPAAIRDGAWSGETAFLDRSGKEIPVSQVIVAHKAPTGSIEFLSTIARDVSERKRLEDQLRQAQKLESVGLLAGGVAHDFNNLLNAIIGFAELALKELPLESTGHRYLSRVPGMGRQAADLIGQLLAFARRAPLERRPLDFNLLLEETAKMLQRMLPETLTIKVEPTPEPLVVQADFTQVQQVLLNLATNARDAMPSGGTLTLRLAPLTLTKGGIGGHPERRPGDFACLTVADTGTGIPAAIRDRIFEPFFTTKAPGQGTGLGLASVYGIVHQHEGWIEVETAEGEGSAFHVFLPRLSIPAPAAASPAEVVLRGTETILLAEDNPMVRELGEILLTRLGYTVVTAADGFEAVEAFRARPEIALVLTDAIMPHMGAADLIPALRALKPEVKVLVATGYASEEIRAALDDLRPRGYIWKPFRQADLAAAVRAALDGPERGAS